MQSVIYKTNCGFSKKECIYKPKHYSEQVKKKNCLM